jgi:hypothetical protein
MPSIRAHLPFSIAHQEIRRTCMVVEHITSAADILDRLPPEALEAIRDYCAKYAEGDKCKKSAFKTCMG